MRTLIAFSVGDTHTFKVVPVGDADCFSLQIETDQVCLNINDLTEVDLWHLRSRARQFAPMPLEPLPKIDPIPNNLSPAPTSGESAENKAG